MNQWEINSGLVELNLPSGVKAYPSAAEILSQVNSAQFVFQGNVFESVNSLGIRFSQIGQTPIIEFRNVDGSIAIILSVIKKDISYIVPKENGVYKDYVICDGVFYFLSGPYTILGKFLPNAENPTLSIAQYLECTHILKEAGVEYEDNVLQELERIKNKGQISQSEIPLLKCALYDYQKIGSAWLTYMIEHGCGCILGDEMGLGKTAQVISVFAAIKSKRPHSHFLVVCPLSLLENWRRELEKFCPSLKVLVHHGPKRTGDYHILLEYDVIVKSYSSIENDCGMLQMVDWDVLAADEAQNIKNPRASRTETIKMISAKAALAITGTPFENHMSDIWSLTDFVLPGYFGSFSEFSRLYTDDADSAYRLEPFLSPLMIRRKASEVLTSLPPRVDIPQPIQMTETEAAYYINSIRTVTNDTSLDNHQLRVIQLLRLFCTHPFVYDKHLHGDPIQYSNKYSRLCELLSEIFSSNEKVIVFTSFSEMIQILVKDIRQRFGVYTDFIDGSIPEKDRQTVLDKFSAHKGAALLALNPIAAGTGLNITAANHVIHYNLEWNPAKEDQASARAHRNGQEKIVFVHRLYYEGTIEEFIDEKICNKRAISSSAVIGTLGQNTREDLRKVLTMSPITTDNYDNN